MNSGIGIEGLSVGKDEYATDYFDLFKSVEIENSIADVSRNVVLNLRINNIFHHVLNKYSFESTHSLCAHASDIIYSCIVKYQQQQ